MTTGHSLGAALAIMCAHDFERSTLIKPCCFAFCSPRCANLAFAQDFNAKISLDGVDLPSETIRDKYKRSYVFMQRDDPVAWGPSQHGFSEDVLGSPKLKSEANCGSTSSQGIYALRAGKSKTAIFYHVGNLIRVSNTGEHSFSSMKNSLLTTNGQFGSSLKKRFR